MTPKIRPSCEDKGLPSKSTYCGFRTVNQPLHTHTHTQKGVWLPTKVVYKSPLSNFTKERAFCLKYDLWFF